MEICAAPEDGGVVEAEREYARAGSFQRVFPDADVEDYLPFLPLLRLTDIMLADARYEARSGRCYTTNPMAAMTWLHATEGLDPDTIAAALRAATA